MVTKVFAAYSLYTLARGDQDFDGDDADDDDLEIAKCCWYNLSMM